MNTAAAAEPRPALAPVDVARFQTYQAALEAVAPGFRFGSDRRFAKFLAGELTLLEEVAKGVRVSVERNESGAFDCRVNWSAIGDVVPERAEAFATDLQTASRRASLLRDVLRSLPADFTPEFLAAVAVGGLL